MGLSVYYTVPAAYTEASKRAESPVIEMPGRALPLPHFLRVSKVFPLNLLRDRFSISAIFGNRGRWQARGLRQARFSRVGVEARGLRQARFSRAGRKSDFGLLGSEF